LHPFGPIGAGKHQQIARPAGRHRAAVMVVLARRRARVAARPRWRRLNANDPVK